MSATAEFLAELLATRLDGRGADWRATAVAEIAGASDARFCSLLALASRHARSAPLEPRPEDLVRAERIVPGWNPERWSLLTALRASLVLARGDLALDSGARALEDAFRFADEGELVALYATLALLPEPERFARRGAEGCRTNMRTVFEAVACDTPFPFRCFDDLAWRQCVVKCVFVGAPLWRVHGLDERLSDELARMALDLVDERRSAGREVQPELWLCLGPYGGGRATAALERELESGPPIGRAAAGIALARAGELGLLRRAMERERDERVAKRLRRAEGGDFHQRAFRDLDRLRATP